MSGKLKLPQDLKHIAIIMDGNGRWAKKQLKERPFGHRKGSENLKPILTVCADAGLKVLSVFAFSSENWDRPKVEVNLLMDLFSEFLEKEKPTILDNNIRFIITGELNRLPDKVKNKAQELIDLSKNNKGTVLNLCVSYGSRQEILDTVKNLCKDVADGKVKVQDIDQALFSSRLWTAGLPDPDLLIRTSGEFRISNFLLWQMAYTEIYVTDVLWPDFDFEELKKAVEEYKKRERRFGLVRS